VLFRTAFTPVHHRVGKTAALSGEFAKTQCQPDCHQRGPVSTSTAPDCRHQRDANTTVNFPILADSDRTVANLYDMIHPNAVQRPGYRATVRSVFIIDPQHVIPHHLHLPASTGRNFDEICGY
jgi:alkyl hydroperoxide reductase subunit AhpC